jgi:hypothetical protein
VSARCRSVINIDTREQTVELGELIAEVDAGVLVPSAPVASFARRTAHNDPLPTTAAESSSQDMVHRRSRGSSSSRARRGRKNGTDRGAAGAKVGSRDLREGRAVLTLHDLDDRARSGSTLSPEAQHLVGLGAVLGTSFCVDDVAELVGEPVAFVTSALDEALDTRLLAPAGDAVGFRDRRMRAAVYRGVTEPMRDALRRRIGWLLLTRGGSDAAAAAHLSVGASPAGTDVLAGLDQAVRDLLATSPAIAADLALRAF